MTEAALPSVGPWAASTVSAPDVDAVERSYSDWLGYRTLHRGVVSLAQAMLWGAPAMAGKRVVVMEPESGKSSYLRIVENPMPAAYKPLTSFGWASSELCVQDADGVEARLRKSPFRLIGPAKDLDSYPDIRATQFVGLAGEVFYFTMFKRKIPGLDLPTAHGLVDRMFIAVLATDGLEKVQAWYQRHFGIKPNPVNTIKLGLIDDAFGVPQGTLDFGITIVPLKARSLVEVDGYPPRATARPANAGHLPPGNAMMTLLVDSLDALGVDWLAPPTELREAPYFGRRAAVTKGAMGELIELVERDAS
jgi:hypothetical protein